MDRPKRLKAVCGVCGWEWMVRAGELPKRCVNPKCRSVRWREETKKRGRGEAVTGPEGERALSQRLREGVGEPIGRPAEPILESKAEPGGGDGRQGVELEDDGRLPGEEGEGVVVAHGKPGLCRGCESKQISYHGACPRCGDKLEEIPKGAR